MSLQDKIDCAVRDAIIKVEHQASKGKSVCGTEATIKLKGLTESEIKELNSMPFIDEVEILSTNNAVEIRFLISACEKCGELIPSFLKGYCAKCDDVTE